LAESLQLPVVLVFSHVWLVAAWAEVASAPRKRIFFR
jgi:hypothetical protein